MSILDKFKDMPPLAKVVGGGLTMLGFATLGAWVAGVGSQWIVAVIILIVLCILAWVGFVLARRAYRKWIAGKFGAKVRAGADSSGGAQSAEDRALNEKLQADLSEGLERFEKINKDVYSIPWIVLVGPPQSGKSKMLSTSTVCKESDRFKGASGTLGMNWWFTSKVDPGAVVLDMAGAVFMDQGQVGRWEKFLGFLRDNRKSCPINGVMLVVSTENLLEDSAEKVHELATAVKGQLERMREKLDVRFPVWVVVTKCDKIPGFKQFFDDINDIDLQHQILGWSNPESLDEPFKPEQLENHLETVIDGLRRARLTKMQNMVRAQGIGQRQSDRVDVLFALPDEIAKITPALRRYLELIFVQDADSQEPPFLRGVYFTSSERKGGAIFARLRELGIPAREDSWPDRAFFLRDLFAKKVFRETKLVTRANNVDRSEYRKKAIKYGVGVAAVVSMIVFTAFSFFGFQKQIAAPQSFYARVETMYGTGPRTPEIENAIRGRALVATKDGAMELHVDEERLALLVESKTYANKGVSVPWAFKLVSWVDRISVDDCRAVHRRLLRDLLLAPLYQAAIERLSGPNAWADLARTEELSVPALAEVLRVEAAAEGATARTPRPALLNLGPVVKFVFQDNPEALARYAPVSATLDALVLNEKESFFKESATELGAMAQTEQISKAIEQFKAFQTRAEDRAFAAAKSAAKNKVAAGAHLADTMIKAQQALELVRQFYTTKAPPVQFESVAEFDQFSTECAKRVDAFGVLAKEVGETAKLVFGEGVALSDQAIKDALDKAQTPLASAALARCDTLLAGLPPNPTPASTTPDSKGGSVLDSVVAAAKEGGKLIGVGKSGGGEAAKWTDAISKVYTDVVTSLKDTAEQAKVGLVANRTLLGGLGSTNGSVIEASAKVLSGITGAAVGAKSFALPASASTDASATSQSFRTKLDRAALGAPLSNLSPDEFRIAFEKSVDPTSTWITTTVDVGKGLSLFAARRRVHQVIRTEVDRLSKVEELRTDVQLRVTPEIDAARSVGAIPLTIFEKKSFQLPAEYMPQAAKPWLEDWDVLSARAAQKSQAEKTSDVLPLTDGYLAKDIADLAIRVEQYRHGYVQYWSIDLAKNLEPQQCANWDDFKKLIGAIKSVQTKGVNRVMRELFKLARDVSSDPAATPEQRAEFEKIVADWVILQKDNNDVHNDSREWVNGWPSQTTSELALSEIVKAKDCGELAFSTLAHFWKSAAKRGVEAITNERRIQAADSRKWIMEHPKFPLVQSSEGLTLQEYGVAAAKMRALSGAGGGLSRIACTDPDLKKAFAALVEAGSILSEKGQHLSTLFSKDEELTVTVTACPKPEGVAVDWANNQRPNFEIFIEGRSLGMKATNSGSLQFNVAVPSGSAVQNDLKLMLDERTLGESISLGDQWHLLRRIAEFGRINKEGKYSVEMGRAEDKPFMLQLAPDRPLGLPTWGQWPSRAEDLFTQSK